MTRVERVAIIGLGLMGGSLARALAARDVPVIGFDNAPESLDAAVVEGIVQERLDASLEGIERADVVVLALPVDATLAAIPRLAPRLANTRLVMDLASTKRSIVEAAERASIGAQYVGAHPLTGSHRSGWRASRANLFDEARVFLCPTVATSPEALRIAESFWRGLRAGVEVLDAATHDVQMAWRSHLPHVLSAMLARTLHEAGIHRSSLGPGGRDMTRLAGGEPSIWTSIVEDNGEALGGALDALEHQLLTFKRVLGARDTEATNAFLMTSRTWFDGDPQAPRGGSS